MIILSSFEFSVAEDSMVSVRDAFKKKIAEKETLVHTGGRGVKKFPFLSSPKRGHILMVGGVKIF